MASIARRRCFRGGARKVSSFPSPEACKKKEKEHEAVRHFTGKLEEGGRGAGMNEVHRNRRETAAERWSSGVGLGQPQGTIRCEEGGE